MIGDPGEPATADFSTGLALGLVVRSAPLLDLDPLTEVLGGLSKSLKENGHI